MAKGQKRSNRELRKPKQAKVSDVPKSPFGSQVKAAGDGPVSMGKGPR